MNFLLVLFLLIICINKSSTDKITDDEIVFLNIHNTVQRIGDVIFIHSQGKTAMIDVGLKKDPNGKNEEEKKQKRISFQGVKKYITNHEIKNLQWILITHNHGDHIGGIKDLLDIKDLKVGKVYTKRYRASDASCDVNGKTINADKRLEWWNSKIKAIKNKVGNDKDGNSNLRYITGKSNNELTLGNYHFKLFNTPQAFYNKFDAYCAKYCCNENVNSIVATARNKDGNKFYYLAGDIQTYPNPADSNVPQFAELQTARAKYTLDFWVEKAKNYWNDILIKENINFDHFHVFKASHHGIIKNKYGYNNSKKAFLDAKPDKCVITSALESRTSLNDKLTEFNNNSTIDFNCEILFTGTKTVVIKNKELN